MNIAAVSWVLQLKIDPAAKHVLTVMAISIDTNIYAETLKTLESSTCWDKSTLIRCLRYLVEISAIKVTNGSDGRRTAYELLVNSTLRSDIPLRKGSSVRPIKRLQPATEIGSNVQPKKVAHSNQSPKSPSHSPILKGNIYKSGKKNLAASAAGDSRHHPIIAFLKEQHPDLDIPPKDHGALKALLKRRPDLSIETFREWWARFVNSTVPYEQQQGLSLAFFCNNPNRFNKERTDGNGKFKRETPAEAAERYNEEQSRIVLSRLAQKASSSIRSVGSGSTSDDLP